MRGLIRRVIHCRVYFLRAAGWLSGGTFCLVLWGHLKGLGYDLQWYEMVLVIFSVFVAMVCWGWLEFRINAVDHENELFARHTPLFRKLEKKAEE